MPYIMTETRYSNGDIRVEKCFSLRYGKKCSRGCNTSSTTETQKDINYRLSCRKREDLILNNFSVGDIWATLTYPRYLRYDSFDLAHKNAAKFIKKIKRKYPHIKYFFKTETSFNDNYHHHLIFSWGGHTKTVTFFDADGEEHESVVPLTFIDLRMMWRDYLGIDKNSSGGGEFKEIYNMDNGELIKYFNKRIPIHNDSNGNVIDYLPVKFSHSRNLVKPIVIKKIITNKSWRRIPKPRKGYDITDLFNGSDFIGFEKQTYILRKRC